MSEQKNKCNVFALMAVGSLLLLVLLLWAGCASAARIPVERPPPRRAAAAPLRPLVLVPGLVGSRLQYSFDDVPAMVCIPIASRTFDLTSPLLSAPAVHSVVSRPDRECLAEDRIGDARWRCVCDEPLAPSVDRLRMG